MDPQTQDQSTVVPPIANEPVAAPEPSVVSARQQVVERLQSGKNVLVTVGADPSVDELASALGITLLLNKLGKHVTAVFSGKIPQAMEFLEPETTFENTVDSLRDFIIALSKEKADKLRYKVEEDVVKIFITPYKTVLSEKDLEFSQGDFNVDIILALGVEKREELDKAIIAHGRILHDATVITVNPAGQHSDLGAIDWNEPTASSVAEMLVGLSADLGADLLDEPISTAFLTGIVAETNRFSNEKTNPKIMTLAAQLMAAGANQQLIATNLRQEGMISEPVRTKTTDQPHDDGGEMVLDHEEAGKDAKSTDKKITPKSTAKSAAKAASSNEKKPPIKKSVKQPTETATPAQEPEPPTSDSTVVADAVPTEPPEASETAAAPTIVPETNEPPISASDSSSDVDTSEPTVAESAESKTIEPLPSTETLPVEEPTALTNELPSLPSITPEPNHPPMEPPTFGGTLNATTAAAEEAREAEAKHEAETNNVALDHVVSPDPPADPATSDNALEAARQAVQDAEISQPFDPANKPLESIGATPLPSIDPASGVDAGVSELQSTNTPSSPGPQPTDKPEISPVDAFMQPHDEPPASADLNALTPPTPQSTPMPPVPPADGLPPLPPMPSDGAAGLPPLPPLPGQPGSDPAAGMQPQINPGFVQDMPSQNTWSQAADDLAAKQADKDAERQAKMDKMSDQYDQAVDRNRELQGLPPINDPNGSGLPPLPPVS